MTRYIVYSIGVLLLCFIGYSCKRVADPCLQPKSLTVAVGMYRPADTGSAGVDSTLPKAYIGYVYNGRVHANGVKASKFNLYLNPNSDTCQWFISPDSTAAAMDTITLMYIRELNFVSRSCGYNYRYYIHNVKSTLNRIDSVVIKNNAVTGATSVENVKVFY